MTRPKKQHVTSDPIDLSWCIPHDGPDLLQAEIFDELQRPLLVIEATNSLHVGSHRRLAHHIVAVHNGWLERQAHLDRITAKTQSQL